MTQKKIIENVHRGDSVVANYTGGHPESAVRGRVTHNDAQKCVIDMGNGRNAIIFGDTQPEPARGFPGIEVKRVM